MTLARLTLKSGNSKTGSIAVSMSDRSTCPDACSFKNNGCYALGWPTVTHWDNVSTGKTGQSWIEFCRQVERDTTPGAIWRHNSAGDLPGKGDTIDVKALEQLVQANAAAGARGFTYTHKPATLTAVRRSAARRKRSVSKRDLTRMRANRAAIVDATFRGFVVNVSHDSLEELDASGHAFPSVVVLPQLERGEPESKHLRTPGGMHVVVCPAQWRDTTCAECRLCSDATRTYAIGFRAHGYAHTRVSRLVSATQLVRSKRTT